MSYDPGALRIALAAAVGDDPALVAELRGAFIASATAMADLLAGSRCNADWQAAAWRLHGLAGSFGAVELMDLAAAAAHGAPGDPQASRLIDDAIAAFEG